MRRLSPTSGAEPAKKAGGGARTSHFRSGLAVDAPRKRIYSLDVDRGTISALDLETLKELKSVACGTRPYDVVMARNGHQLYVSDWAGRSIRVLDPGELQTVARIAVGEHPTQIAVHPTDDRIFVACASSNCVSVIDTRRGIVTETINTALFPLAPEGSTPDALAVAPDGKTLFVANADNNNVAVVDIAVPSHSQVKGFIPTGWYPTAVAVTPDGKQLLIGVGKGLQTKANPINTAQDERGIASHGPPAVSLHRDHAVGLALDRARSRRQGASRLYRDRLQELPLFRQAVDRCPLPRENRHSRPGSAIRRRSSTCCTSSRRIAPTIRCSATCRGAMATLRS